MGEEPDGQAMKMIDVANASYGRWPEILQALGANPEHLKGVNKPCPFCGGKDRYTFGDKGNGAWFCRQCGHGDGFDFLAKLHGWNLSKAMAEVAQCVGSIPAAPAHVTTERSDEDKADACRRLLKASGRVVPGTPAFRYLANRCGDPGLHHGNLWAHPGLRHRESGGVHPALLAVLKSSDGSGVSVHRTYLTEDGNKALVDPVKKMMPGLPLNGASIHLGPVMPRMGIAEGIETALCAAQLFGLPVWAATCAGLLKTWEPPEGCREVVIFADNDAGFTGQDAAFDLAKRLCHRGIRWEIQIPEQVGTDWCDVLHERG